MTVAPDLNLIEPADLRLLIVEKNIRHLDLLRVWIKEGLKGIRLQIRHFVSLPDFFESPPKKTFDVCFLNWHSSPNILDDIRALKGRKLATWIFVLMRSEDMKMETQAMEAGATDCILIDRLSPELISRLIRYNLTLRDREDDLKKIEADLLEAHSQNQQLLSSITSILIGVRPDGKIHHWNAIAEKTFGVSQQKVANKVLVDCDVDWETARVWAAVCECYKKNQPIRLDDVLFTRINGEKGYLGFSIIPMRDSKNEVRGILLFGADITRRKEDEEQLRQRTAELAEANLDLAREKIQYQTLLENIGDGMIAVNQAGKVVMMNFQAESMLGYKRDELIGRDFDECIPMEDEKGNQVLYEARPIHRTFHEGKRVIQTIFYMRKDQNLMPVSVTVSPIILEGRIAGAIEIFRDITKQLEMDRLKSEFISTVSHEIRTPLTGIREGVSQVLDGLFGPVNDDQREFLNISLKEIQRLTSIVNDLLDMSKIEAGKIELKKKWMDFGPLIKHLSGAYQGLLKSKGLSLKTILPEESVKVYADEEKVTQVLTNLISNASKFTEEGGCITIEVIKKQNEIEVSVQDSGRGIHPNDLHRVFERFVQVGRTDGPGMKGTGLGLPICKSLIELHKGRMWAESEPGKGSRFLFTLPLDAADGAVIELRKIA